MFLVPLGGVYRHKHQAKANVQMELVGQEAEIAARDQTEQEIVDQVPFAYCNNLLYVYLITFND